MQDPFAPEGNASAGMLVMWLTMRFLVILIPMYAVLRVMHTMRHQQVQQDVDRQLEQEMMTLLWVCSPSVLHLHASFITHIMFTVGLVEHASSCRHVLYCSSMEVKTVLCAVPTRFCGLDAVEVPCLA